MFLTRSHSRIVPLGVACLLAGASLSAAEPEHSTRSAPAISAPTVADDSLQVTLFASDPEIVTPIGIAPAPWGGVLVVESHTHSPPPGYSGPKRDRILWFHDTTGDGRADRREVFAEGFDDAMNLAVAADGAVYVVQRASVVRLRDTTGDRRADEQTEIVRLETKNTYDHSGLLSVLVRGDGRLLIGRGNVGGHAFRYVGSDGSQLFGYGDGGDVVLCDADGANLERFSTGFWNPFALAEDRRGWLLCADNDPDAVGPNRIVHLIPGGDYGYRSAYGPSGRWPLSAWNGELPGTLPWAVGVGEAPSGLLAADDAGLPASYAGQWLVTLWGEHRIDRVEPRVTAQGLRGEAIPWITGSDQFRPVAITQADGAIYVTDWVRKDYPNHGQGRIWRIAARDPHAASRRTPTTDPYAQRLDRVASLEVDALWEAAVDDDPILRSLAVRRLADQPRGRLVERLDDSDSAVRLAALLALRQSSEVFVGEQEKTREGEEDADLLRRALDDPSSAVRIAALAWIAEDRRAELRGDLPRVLDAAAVSPRLVEVLLAADEAVSPEALGRHERQERGMAHRRQFVAATLEQLLRREELPPAARASLLRLSEHAADAVRQEVAIESLDAEHDDLVRAALQTLATLTDSPPARGALLDLAQDNTRPSSVRADAVAALEAVAGDHAAAMRRLLGDAEPEVRYEAMRAARRLLGSNEAIRAAVQSHLEPPQSEKPTRGDSNDPHRELLLDEPPFHDAQARFQETAAHLLSRHADAPPPHRPHDETAWWEAVGAGGSADAGRRVFFSAEARCIQCHIAEGRGGWVGPELSEIGRGHDRANLLRSILHPSAEIAPEYQSYSLLTVDGQVERGIQFHFRSGGKAISLITIDGVERTFDLDDLEDYRADTQSLMPDALADALSVTELRDLLAYLQSLQGD